MKDTNYVTMMGYMRTKYNLKGAELITFALIHGYTQNGEDWFTGSISEIQEWTGTSKRNVISILQSLVAKGLLIKSYRETEKGMLPMYRTVLLDEESPKNEETEADPEGVKKIHRGGEKISPGGGEKSSPHNNSSCINNLNTPYNPPKGGADYQQEFEALWEKYPRKQNKRGALRSYVTARKSGVDFVTISNGIDAYIRYIEAEGVEQRYIKYGSSWFRQYGWENDYTSEKELKKQKEQAWRQKILDEYE